MRKMTMIGLVALIGSGFAACLMNMKPCDRMPNDGDSASYVVFDLTRRTVQAIPRAPQGGWSAADKANRLVCRQINPGAFFMGTSNSPGSLICDDSPRHRVTLTRGYAIGVFEVTQGQWRHLMEADGRPESATDDIPVDDMTREKAMRFLKTMEQRFPTYAFTFPTEAEWEYACRAGAESPDVDAWQSGNAGGRAHPVGGRSPNAWGLYDLCGNVWEWCLDKEGPYGDAPVVDPVVLAQSGTSPLFSARGGSWRNSAEVCSPTHRAFFFEEINIIPIGLRVVCRQKTSKIDVTDGNPSAEVK